MVNVRNDWTFEKNDGFGVKGVGNYYIDPMFDSEMFTIYDLYWKAKNRLNKNFEGDQQFFEILFAALRETKSPMDDVIIREIIDWLPVDTFIGEEHLKNWIVKRFYSEELLLRPELRTKSYFMLGMGLLDGKRMSASRGHAILTKDILASYGPTVARLVLLLTGGHPSKPYSYSKDLPEQSRKLISEFTSYYLYLRSMINTPLKTSNPKFKKIIFFGQNIEKKLESGYFRQAVLEVLSIIPKKFRNLNKDEYAGVLGICDKYLDILLPGLYQKFNF